MRTQQVLVSCVTTLLVGSVVVLAISLLVSDVVALMATRGLFANKPIIYGMLVSLVVFVVVSLLTARPSEERMRTWENKLGGSGTPP